MKGKACTQRLNDVSRPATRNGIKPLKSASDYDHRQKSEQIMAKWWKLA
jgi:hypothetical protein